jgi:hypothetical protein
MLKGYNIIRVIDVKILVGIFALIISLLCFGFKDLSELEDRNFFITIGLDNNSSNDCIKEINQINMTSVCISFDDLKPGKKIILGDNVRTESKKNLEDLINEFKIHSGKDFYLGYVKVIFLDKCILNNENAFREIMNILKNNSLSSKARIYVCDNAESIILKWATLSELMSFTKNIYDESISIDQLS